MAKKDTAAKETIALDTLYLVGDTDQSIALEVITGGINQTSTINVEIIGSQIIAKGIQGNLPQTTIGSNKELQGKILSVTCSIADTSRDTNYTELRIRLNGGILFMEYPLFATVAEEGDSVNYVCVVRFFKP
ncbi:hypothetical protein J0X19_22285 [Hymenobacter sp. BT186]|uniref:Uncharacterized protein n=1 Tax=Hymenobacter telluris TaxID=2816474 RepID=A0A939F0X1_9BACT|nr:hypothetical protein [Hymenobacter telluris]MBO0360706.1 hypothetical protein [Hymenobacter telluris]MBW3376733.1 hypothetical protein [Hymenobacter norwichensis]